MHMRNRGVSRRVRGMCLAAAAVACGGAGMSPSTALALGVQTTTVYTQTNLLGAADDAQFVALVDADLHRPPIVMFSWGSRPAGPASATIDLPTADQFTDYAVFGRDSAGGVFVSFASPNTGIAKTWDALFPTISESQLADDLLTNGPTVTAFANLLAQTPEAITQMGVQCHTTHFSTGADYGTITASFSPIPEPASGALVIVTAAGCALRRRRRHRDFQRTV
jgi:hypothetical protein